MNESPILPGAVLAGKYRVERVLGSGGMGVVVAAVHVELGQPVALKFLLPHALENAEAAARFIREARACVKIDSEHVARVLDVGRLESGAPYMVMEYLEGTDLSQHARGEQLPIETAIDFVLQACSAMAVAHAAGIIHRDLKPPNLFLTQRPDGSALLKVLDFGISKTSVVDAPPGLTNSRALMGSPHFMSPEQVQSARGVDARTDIWSLGVVLYELLTGELPFPGETLHEVLTAVMVGTPKPIRLLRPSVPAKLEEAVMRALEKPLERRYANIAELTAALVEFAPVGSRVLHERVSGVMNRAGLSSAPPGPLLAKLVSEMPPAPGTPPVVSATNGNWTERSKPRKGQGSALVIAAALLVVGLGAALWAHRRADTNDARTTPQASPVAVPTLEVKVSAAPIGEAAPAPEAVNLTAPSSEKAAPAVQHAKPPSAPMPGAPAPSLTSSADSLALHRKKNPLSIEFK